MSFDADAEFARLLGRTETDPVRSQMREMAESLAAFKKEMLAVGFDHSEAFDLTRDFFCELISSRDEDDE